MLKLHTNASGLTSTTPINFVHLHSVKHYEEAKLCTEYYRTQLCEDARTNDNEDFFRSVPYRNPVEKTTVNILPSNAKKRTLECLSKLSLSTQSSPIRSTRNMFVSERYTYSWDERPNNSDSDPNLGDVDE